MNFINLKCINRTKCTNWKHFQFIDVHWNGLWPIFRQMYRQFIVVFWLILGLHWFLLCESKNVAPYFCPEIIQISSFLTELFKKIKMWPFRTHCRIVKWHQHHYSLQGSQQGIRLWCIMQVIYILHYCYYYCHFTAFCLGPSGWASVRSMNYSGFYWSKHDGVAVASAELYASYLHFAPGDNHASTSSLRFLRSGCPSWRPTSSIKALKAEHWRHSQLKYIVMMVICQSMYLFLTTFPHYCTCPDIALENGRGVLLSCAVLDGFAIGAWVTLPSQQMCLMQNVSEDGCTRHMAG